MSATTDDCIHSIFTQRAAGRPDARALVRGGEVLSYGELDRLSDVLTADLEQQGVRCGQTIALLMDGC